LSDRLAAVTLGGLYTPRKGRDEGPNTVLVSVRRRLPRSFGVFGNSLGIRRQRTHGTPPKS
jgi:hypothetical protein